MTSNSEIRSVIIYSHSDLDATHESWLLEWALDWFEHSAQKLRITRTCEEDVIRVKIVIWTDPFSSSNDWYDHHIMNLLEEVDHLLVNQRQSN